jgi:hypothetical protein
MEVTGKQAMSTATKVAVALVAGLVVLLLLFRSGGVDSQPPVCSSIFNLYAVPCEGWVAPAAAAATAALVFAVLWLIDRRR